MYTNSTSYNAFTSSAKVALRIRSIRISIKDHDSNRMHVAMYRCYRDFYFNKHQVFHHPHHHHHIYFAVLKYLSTRVWLLFSPLRFMETNDV